MTLYRAEILTGLTEQHLFCRQDGFKLHKEVAGPFSALCAAANADGIDIKIVSSFRSYQRQADIWQAKLSGKRAVLDMHGNTVNITTLSGKARLDAVLLYSALPGASRHHWGTELDIYDAGAVENGYQPRLAPQEYASDGPFDALQQWLTEHADAFGFFLPYQHYQGGVAAEPWHLSYQPLAQQYLAAFSPSILKHCLTQHPIAEQTLVLEHLDEIFNQYVSNICTSAA